MAQSLGLHPQQNYMVVAAVAAGKTIALNVSPCPGGGAVWPHLTANSVPLVNGSLTPKQVQFILDYAAAGKTAAVNFSTALGRNHIDFT